MKGYKCYSVLIGEKFSTDGISQQASDSRAEIISVISLIDVALFTDVNHTFGGLGIQVVDIKSGSVTLNFDHSILATFS